DLRTGEISVFGDRIMRRRPAAGDRLSWLTRIVLGFGIWIAFPTAAAYQDMVSLVSGTEAQHSRWNAYVERSAAGSVHQAEMPYIDSTTTGTISGSGIKRP